MPFLDIFTKTDDNFTANDKCDFCSKPLHEQDITFISFELLNESSFQCCPACYTVAKNNNMKITSLEMIRAYIEQHNITLPNDTKLKIFFGTQINQNGMWYSILGFDFFFTLPFFTGLKDRSTLSNPISNQDDDSCFWTSYVVTEYTHSPFLGYVAGRSFLGTMLGSSHSSQNEDSLSATSHAQESINIPQTDEVEDEGTTPGESIIETPSSDSFSCDGGGGE